MQFVNVHTPLDKEVARFYAQVLHQVTWELLPSLKWATANHVASSTSLRSGWGLKGCIQGLNWLLRTQTIVFLKVFLFIS